MTNPSNNYPVLASEVRGIYATMFQNLAELCGLIYGEKPNMIFEEIIEASDKLFREKYISEYIYESLKHLYALYPELFPSRVAQDYRTNEKKERIKLKDIKNLLNIMIKELNDEINDKAESTAESLLLNQEDEWL